MKTGIVITSPQNPKIKSLLSLTKYRERREHQLFIVEGKKETQMAINAGYTIANIFYNFDLITEAELQCMGLSNELLIPVNQNIYNKIAVRENSVGIISVAKMKNHSLETITLRDTPLILVIESVEKPGNLGAMLRTADATSVDAVIISDPRTDLYNPNVVRSSLGCLFNLAIATATSEATVEWLERNNIKIFCSSLQSAQPYCEADFTQPCAIVMGKESTGLSEIWRNHATLNLKIPMLGKIDSLNVSNATAVMLYEAIRQRNTNNRQNKPHKSIFV